MLSVVEQLITLMCFLGFLLFLRNLICAKYRRTQVFMKINEAEKLAEIPDQVNKRKPKYIITQLTKKIVQSIYKNTRKRFQLFESNKKNKITTSFDFKLCLKAGYCIRIIFSALRKLRKRNELNTLMLGGNKRSYILKQTSTFFMQSKFRRYDLLLPPIIKG